MSTAGTADVIEELAEDVERQAPGAFVIEVDRCDVSFERRDDFANVIELVAIVSLEILDVMRDVICKSI